MSYSSPSFFFLVSPFLSCLLPLLFLLALFLLLVRVPSSFLFLVFLLSSCFLPSFRAVYLASCVLPSSCAFLPLLLLLFMSPFLFLFSCLASCVLLTSCIFRLRSVCAYRIRSANSRLTCFRSLDYLFSVFSPCFLLFWDCVPALFSFCLVSVPFRLFFCFPFSLCWVFYLILPSIRDTSTLTTRITFQNPPSSKAKVVAKFRTLKQVQSIITPAGFGKCSSWLLAVIFPETPRLKPQFSTLCS